MSNVNNYSFAKALDLYKANEIDKLTKNVEDATKIMADPNYVWETPEKKEAGKSRFAQMQSRLAILEKFHEEGMLLVKQHENIINQLSKWYDAWYQNISNDGLQETEMMGSQADMLQTIFAEMWAELKPLNLDIKPPRALNL